MNKIYLIFLFSILIVLETACTRPTPTTAPKTSEKKTNKPLIYCSEGSPSFFNPQLASDGSSFDIARSIYDRLVEFKETGSGIQPGLAHSWSVSEDELTYTFHLRKDVAFHETDYFKPTRNFNADDVIFSFQRQKNKNHPYHLVNGGAYMYFQSLNMGDLIKNIVKVNTHTVQFILSQKDSTFLPNMAMEFAGILSKEYANQLSQAKKMENMDFKPVGTGPFIFKKYIKDSLVRLNTNKKYFKGPHKNLSGIIVSIVPDTHVRVQKLKTGECDLINQPAPTDLPDIEKHPQLKLVGGVRFNVAYLAMNTEKPPFNNVKVRQAVHHLLNRRLYVKAIYENYAEVAKNPYPSSLWSYNHEIKDYEYSVEKAKKLLKEAGYPDGFNATLWTLPIARPYNPNGKKMGELMQADLAKANIKIKLQTYDWPTYISRSKKGEHDLIQFGWTSDNGDPDNFLRVLLSCDSVASGVNAARWCNVDFDKLITKAIQVRQQEKRESLYKEAQKIFKEQAPWVTLVHTQDYVAMKKNIEGYIHKPFGSKSFYTVYFKQ